MFMFICLAHRKRLNQERKERLHRQREAAKLARLQAASQDEEFQDEEDNYGSNNASVRNHEAEDVVDHSSLAMDHLKARYAFLTGLHYH
eukprot:m.223876 g.223876  ORF g.223876 m.223876 type:complete len:89 (+) comp17027_c3_seq4:1968-2234(+)